MAKRKPIRSDIAWSTSDRIVVRGKDLAGEILGKVDLGDFAFFLITNRMPSEAESRVFNAMVVT
ncbi:MAG: citryl-CoA lyase, partial [Betaproteobacteria bacterium]|nr:citryl-CoA lyase [Betaproteobacteria bacterium]